MTPLIVLPAAGSSSRMRGRDKLLEHIDGVPLLRRQAQAALASGCPVAVTLPVGGEERREVVRGLPLEVIEVRDSHQGMSGSLRAATAALARGQALGILLPDVPGIGADDIRTVLKRFLESGAARVTRGGRAADDRPGTPLFLPHPVALRFADLSGDEGGRSALKGEEVDLVRFPDDRALRDLDKPEDWDAWRRDAGKAH